MSAFTNESDTGDISWNGTTTTNGMDIRQGNWTAVTSNAFTYSNTYATEGARSIYLNGGAGGLHPFATYASSQIWERMTMLLYREHSGTPTHGRIWIDPNVGGGTHSGSYSKGIGVSQEQGDNKFRCRGEDGVHRALTTDWSESVWYKAECNYSSSDQKIRCYVNLSSSEPDTVLPCNYSTVHGGINGTAWGTTLDHDWDLYVDNLTLSNFSEPAVHPYWNPLPTAQTVMSGKQKNFSIYCDGTGTITYDSNFSISILSNTSSFSTGNFSVEPWYSTIDTHNISVNCTSEVGTNSSSFLLTVSTCSGTGGGSSANVTYHSPIIVSNTGWLK